MSKDFNKGDKVAWQSHGTTVVGTVEEKITRRAIATTYEESKGWARSPAIASQPDTPAPNHLGAIRS
jgi:hypothetical protein